ncbi:MAG: Fis family transcriptional regulator [Magnetococcales bacterium]|nr:integrase domain-containing protein [Magnetococcales bacterium]NGZ25408.1 Fis family transcriptional regulator [Magnetococcales bacterium]
METAYGWKAKLDKILREHIRGSSRHPGKSVSIQTQVARRAVLFMAFKTLREDLGFRIEEPDNLKPKHVEALAKFWEESNLSASTIQNRISHMRVFAGWINKQGMIQSPCEYLADPQRGKRTLVAEKDRSWEGNGIDLVQVLESVKAADPWIAIQLELQAALGLRRQESWRLRPGIDWNHSSDVHVFRGTKGGRSRRVPVDTEAKVEVLQRALAMAGPDGSMMPANYTLKRWLSHYDYFLQKLGITKQGLGVTSHGLRHEYVHGRYQERMGVPAPVRGGEKPAMTTDERRVAERHISEEMGHSRPSIVTAYSGSNRKTKTVRKPSNLG